MRLDLMVSVIMLVLRGPRVVDRRLPEPHRDFQLKNIAVARNGSLMLPIRSAVHCSLVEFCIPLVPLARSRFEPDEIRPRSPAGA